MSSRKVTIKRFSTKKGPTLKLGERLRLLPVTSRKEKPTSPVVKRANKILHFKRLYSKTVKRFVPRRKLLFRLSLLKVKR